MTAAGWFTDPSDPARQRYWDGVQWTDHFAPAAAPPAPAPVPASPPGPPAAPVWGQAPASPPGFAHVPAPPPWTQPTIGPRAAAPGLSIVAAVAIGLTFLASFLPWGKIAFITVDGTDGDGVITAVVALLAAGFLFAGMRASAGRRAFLVIATVLMVASTAVFLYDGANIADLGSGSSAELDFFEIDVSVGVGIYLGAAGGIVAVVSLLLLAIRGAS